MLPGLFIVLACTGILSSVKTPVPYTGEWYGILALGLAFILFAAAMALNSDIIEIDFNKQEIRRHKRILHRASHERYAFSDFDGIYVTRAIDENSESYRDIIYPVRLNAPNGRHLILKNYNTLEHAIALATTIASCTGLKAFDATTEACLPLGSADALPHPTFTNDSAKSIPMDDLSSIDFTWDGNRASLAKLFTGNYHGQPAFKLVYPKFLMGQIIGTAGSIAFFMYIFGWRLDKVCADILRGFFDPAFTSSGDVFFSTIFGALFMAFLIYIPAIRLIIMLLRAPQNAYAVLTDTGLLWKTPIKTTSHNLAFSGTGSEVMIPYTAIKSLDIKINPTRGNRKQWKWEMRPNYIAVRTGTVFYEIGNGLTHEQLQKIAAPIAKKMTHRSL